MNDKIVKDDCTAVNKELEKLTEIFLLKPPKRPLINRKCISCDFHTVDFDVLHNHQMSKHTSEELSYAVIKNQNPLVVLKPCLSEKINTKSPLTIHNSEINDTNVIKSYVDPSLPLKPPPLRRPHQFPVVSNNIESSSDHNLKILNEISALQIKSSSDVDLLFDSCANRLCDDLIKTKQKKLKQKRLNGKKRLPCNMSAVLKQLRKPKIDNLSNENQSDTYFLNPMVKLGKKLEILGMCRIENEDENNKLKIPILAEKIEDKKYK